MKNVIQDKFDIVVTDHEFDEHEDAAVTITVETSEHKFHVQTTDGVFDSSMGCWMLTDYSDGDIDWDDYADAYEKYSDDVLSIIIKLAENESKRLLKDKTIQSIRDNDVSGDIEAKAKQISEIVGGDADDYLILSNTLSNADSIEINDTMIFLQINLECSQSQSSEIVDLFI